MQDLRLLAFAARISCAPLVFLQRAVLVQEKIHQYVRTAKCKPEFHIKREKSHRRPNWWWRLTVVTVLFLTSGLSCFPSV